MGIEMQLLMAGLVGCGMAVVYFLGLWGTVRRLPRSPRPWILYFGSLVIRLSVILGGFYLVLVKGQLPALVVCLGGFVFTRVVLVRWLGRISSAPSSLGSEL